MLSKTLIIVGFILLVAAFLIILVDLALFNLLISNFRYTTKFINQETKGAALFYSVIMLPIPIIMIWLGIKLRK
jgi:hypothetical protein